MPEFLNRLTPTQRRILMFGVPVVVIAAIWSLSRNPTGDADTETPAEGDAADGTARPPTGGFITGNTGATGVDSGALASFLAGVNESIEEFRGASGERLAEAVELLRAEDEEWRTELEEMLASRDADRQTPTPQNPAPLPPAAPAPPASPTQTTVINAVTGRPAFTGPSGEGGLAPHDPRVRTMSGLTAWTMPDGRVAYYVPSKNIDAGNLAGLANFRS